MLGLCATGRAQNNWMQYLPDDAYLVDLSIPGAHDAATGNGWASSSSLLGRSSGTTQDIDILNQWNLGVRAFDLRPNISGSRLAINHGILQTKLYFDDAIKMLCGFLRDNPSEFIVIHMLYAQKDNFESNKAKYSTMLKELLGSDDVKDYLIDFRRDLTVKDMRGKMLIISRDPYDTTPYTGGFFNGWGDGIYWNLSISGKNGASAPLHVQDLSNVYNQDAEKKAAIIDLLNFSTKHVATNPEKVVWAFNLPSGYNNSGTSSSNGYRANAVNTHQVFIDYLKENSAGPTGVVLMDYVGVDNSTGYALLGSGANYNTRGLELLNDLIQNNWRYLPKMNAEDNPVTVPYYAYKTFGWTSNNNNPNYKFQVNTWSIEGKTDGSGMLTPFFEDWVDKSGKLGNGQTSYTIHDCQKGLYKVTIRARLLNEAGGAEISGASIFANEESVSITNGRPCTNGYYDDYTVVGTVDEENGRLTFGFNLENPTFNWISFNHIDVEYLGEEMEIADGDFLLNPICEKGVKEEYLQAKKAFEDNPSQENYNAWAKAYQKAIPSVVAYEALKEALDYADSVYPEASKNASKEAKEEYERVIETIKKKYNNGDYADSDIAEVAVPQVYAALAALQQANGGDGEIDMTRFIINNSFETGDLTGWVLPKGQPNDTGVKPQSHDTYTAAGCDGDYLFNTWDNSSGVPIIQTVKGLPNGIYRLNALVTSDNGNTIYLTANDGYNEGTKITANKTVFVEASYEFEVTDGVATIGAVAGVSGTGEYNKDGGVWYKADNFRLTLLSLSDLTDNVTITEARYTAYVTMFDTDFSQTEGLTAYKVTDATAESVTLQEITSAPKGTAVVLRGNAGTYILHNGDAEEATDNIFLAGGKQKGDGQTIYALGYINEVVGFYLVQEGVSVPADKGYLVIDNVDPADIKTFIPFGGEATGIVSVGAEGGKDASTVIYNLAGQRVQTPTKGIYIVNGKKVMVK